MPNMPLRCKNNCVMPALLSSTIMFTSRRFKLAWWFRFGVDERFQVTSISSVVFSKLVFSSHIVQTALLQLILRCVLVMSSHNSLAHRWKVQPKVLLAYRIKIYRFARYRVLLIKLMEHQYMYTISGHRLSISSTFSPFTIGIAICPLVRHLSYFVFQLEHTSHHAQP